MCKIKQLILHSEITDGKRELIQIVQKLTLLCFLQAFKGIYGRNTVIAFPAVDYLPCRLHIGYHMVHRLIVLLHHIFVISQQHHNMLTRHHIAEYGNPIWPAVNHIPQYIQGVLLLQCKSLQHGIIAILQTVYITHDIGTHKSPSSH